MIKTSQSFNRGVLTGVLSIGAINGLGLLTLPHVVVVSTPLRILAVTNVAVCLVWGSLCLRKERRANEDST